MSASEGNFKSVSEYLLDAKKLSSSGQKDEAIELFGWIHFQYMGMLKLATTEAQKSECKEKRRECRLQLQKLLSDFSDDEEVSDVAKYRLSSLIGMNSAKTALLKGVLLPLVDEKYDSTYRSVDVLLLGEHISISTKIKWKRNMNLAKKPCKLGIAKWKPPHRPTAKPKRRATPPRRIFTTNEVAQQRIPLSKLISSDDISLPPRRSEKLQAIPVTKSESQSSSFGQKSIKTGNFPTSLNAEAHHSMDTLRPSAKPKRRAPPPPGISTTTEVASQVITLSELISSDDISLPPRRSEKLQAIPVTKSEGRSSSLFQENKRTGNLLTILNAGAHHSMDTLIPSAKPKRRAPPPPGISTSISKQSETIEDKRTPVCSSTKEANSTSNEDIETKSLNLGPHQMPKYYTTQQLEQQLIHLQLKQPTEMETETVKQPINKQRTFKEFPKNTHGDATLDRSDPTRYGNPPKGNHKKLFFPLICNF